MNKGGITEENENGILLNHNNVLSHYNAQYFS